MKPVIIIGDGGHAEVLLDTARALGRDILGVTSLTVKSGAVIAGAPVLGNDDILKNYAIDEVELVNGIGSVDIPHARASVFERFRELGYTFATLVHPRAIVAEGVILEQGVQVIAGAIIQTGCRLGANTIVNTGAVLDHHGRVGANCHIAPGATCSGGVILGAKCMIGAGTTVIQGLTIGDEVMVAAGAVVVKDLHSKVRVKGIPAVAF